jgi:hypothetical protein
MPNGNCHSCGHEYFWRWEEAFDKFGFGDGDGPNETWQVEDVLNGAGYKTKIIRWTLHNTLITSIRRDGKELIRSGNSEVQLTSPRFFVAI